MAALKYRVGVDQNYEWYNNDSFTLIEFPLGDNGINCGIVIFKLE
jgi:hypothetical protein